MEKELDYVRRNISGQRTLQAKGKLRRLSRQIEALEKLGMDGIQGKSWSEISEETDISAHGMSVDEATRRLRSLSLGSHRPPQLSLNLQTQKRSGNIILRTANIIIGYPNNVLFRAEDIELRRLECAALIGPNGAGKTTFLKTILGQIPPLQGEVNLGASLDIGYFAQAHEDLQPNRSLVEEIDSVAPHMLLAEIRSYLARFLFSGDDVFKKVSMLSGGERGRLALAKLALSRANLLLLDEPSNHLDIPSQEILQDVLANYQGTILLVSHDRYLIDALGTQIWEILEEQETLRVFKGTYSEYHLVKEVEREALKSETETRKTSPAPRHRQDNRPSNEQRQLRRQLKEVEERIFQLEEELAKISTALENPPADPGKVLQLGNEYVRVQEELHRRMEDWERLSAAEES
jgi:ATP-binding cassette, subfamily F, member 3